MIALVVLSIVAAFALPSYQQSLRTAKRADAYVALANVKDAQEIDYNNQAAPRSYTKKLADLGLSTTSNDGLYDLTVTACDETKSPVGGPGPAKCSNRIRRSSGRPPKFATSIEMPVTPAAR